MEHSLVCSVKRGGEGLELFKATNKLIAEASFNQGAFWERRMADLMACLLNTQSHCCVVKQGEGGQSVLRGVFGAGPHWQRALISCLSGRHAGPPDHVPS